MSNKPKTQRIIEKHDAPRCKDEQKTGPNDELSSEALNQVSGGLPAVQRGSGGGGGAG